MRRRGRVRLLAALVACTMLVPEVLLAPAGRAATTVPTVTSVRVQTGPTGSHTALDQGGQRVKVNGTNFRGVRYVFFGGARGGQIHVASPTTLYVTAPRHPSGIIDVRVVTTAGWSPTNSADRVRYEPLSMSATHLNGGLTANQERRISAGFQARAATLRVGTAPNAHKWTAAMARTAVNRARLWVGLPYSWAGGRYTGPSTGVCSPGDAGIFDCHVWGFDCSGLVMYAWSKYRKMVHYAASQYGQAGRFHPTLDELQPGDLLFYSSNGTVAGIHHVVMYVGRGKVIQAPQSGSLVSIDSIDDVIPEQFFGATRPMSTGRQSLPPVVSSISTSRVPLTGGSKLTITGAHFETTSAVRIGALRTRQFTIVSSSKIVVTLPAHAAGTVDVRVGNAWGLSGATAADRLSYTSPPRIAKVTPAYQPLAGGSVTISGIPFLDVTRVTIGGAAVPFRVVDSRTIAATAPAHAAGTAAVQVTTRYGSSPASAVATVQYLSAPAVTAVSPNMIPPAGATVTIHGARFIDVTGLTFGGVPATSYKVLSPTTITATACAHDYGWVPVTVTTRYGRSPDAATRIDDIGYAHAPSITVISPDSGPIAGGNQIDVTGQYFIAPLVVSVDGQALPASAVNVDPNDPTKHLQVTLPPHAAGEVSLTVSNQLGSSAEPVSYTYVG